MRIWMLIGLALTLAHCGGTEGWATPEPAPDLAEAASPTAPEAGALDAPAEAGCSCTLVMFSRDPIGNVIDDCPGTGGTVVLGQHEYDCIGCFGPASLICHVAPASYPASLDKLTRYCCSAP